MRSQHHTVHPARQKTILQSFPSRVARRGTILNELPPTLHLPSVSDLDHILASQNATQLRARLKAARDRVSSTFIRLDGLAVEPTGTHSAMLQYLRRAGCGDDLPGTPPQVVALDWSCADRCSAEGLAFFGVLGCLIQTRGQILIVCSPSASDLAGIVMEAGLQETCTHARWIASQASGRRMTRIASPSLVFDSPIAGHEVLAFFTAIEAVLERNKLPPDSVDLTTSLLMELLQNISTHAVGACASVVAVVHSRRRPAVLEIGLADSGKGMPSTVLTSPRLQWLVPLCDASILEAFVANGFTSRPLEAGGGALREVVLKFLDMVPGGVILIRSGSALIRLDLSLARSLRPTQLSYGFGTQLRVEIPLVPLD